MFINKGTKIIRKSGKNAFSVIPMYQTLGYKVLVYHKLSSRSLMFFNKLHSGISLKPRKQYFCYLKYSPNEIKGPI